jgi:hypothetical protein
MLNHSELFKSTSTLLLLLLICVILSASGCREEQEKRQNGAAVTSGCKSCHNVDPDDHHQFSCTECHRGIEGENSIETSHQGLISQPAHPDNAGSFCGPCHNEELTMVSKNAHYTLSQHINLVRNSFTSPENNLPVDGISSSVSPDSELQLVDDLLRRRCLRCHVYYEGDDFPLTSRASGCGACHLDYYDGQIVTHKFIKKPNDSRCLSCHYGNHIGFDYYGRFEHDFNDEYRTPYTTREDFFRPYGVEFHQLEPDVHQKGGMICIDCHGQEQVMSSASRGTTCISCHQLNTLKNTDNETITLENNQYLFTSEATGIILALPIMIHPAHQKYGKQVSCQGCHALWAFDDDQTHLVRIDHDDLDELEKLTFDGSSEILRILSSHMEFDGEWLDPVMDDKFTGDQFPGIWLKGFKQRRWENIRLIPDSNGLLQVARPLLNLHLSWIDEEEIVRFDNITIQPDRSTDIPYAPHTIGKAGPFYEKRFIHLLSDSDRTSNQVNN